MYAIIEHAPGEFSLLPTDLYRQRGSDRWKRTRQWEDEQVDPSSNCTHIFVSGDLYELSSDDGQDLRATAERNLDGLQTMYSQDPPAAPPPPPVPGGSSLAFVFLMTLTLLNAVGIYLVLQKL